MSEPSATLARTDARGVITVFFAGAVVYLAALLSKAAVGSVAWGLVLGLVVWGVVIGREVPRGPGRLRSVIGLVALGGLWVAYPMMDALDAAPWGRPDFEATFARWLMPAVVRGYVAWMLAGLLAASVAMVTAPGKAAGQAASMGRLEMPLALGVVVAIPVVSVMVMPADPSAGWSGVLVHAWTWPLIAGLGSHAVGVHWPRGAPSTATERYVLDQHKGHALLHALLVLGLVAAVFMTGVGWSVPLAYGVGVALGRARVVLPPRADWLVGVRVPATGFVGMFVWEMGVVVSLAAVGFTVLREATLPDMRAVMLSSWVGFAQLLGGAFAMAMVLYAVHRPVYWLLDRRVAYLDARLESR